MKIGGEHHGFIKGIGGLSDEDKTGLGGNVGASIASIYNTPTNVQATEKANKENSIMYGHVNV